MSPMTSIIGRHSCMIGCESILVGQADCRCLETKGQIIRCSRSTLRKAKHRGWWKTSSAGARCMSGRLYRRDPTTTGLIVWWAVLLLHRRRGLFWPAASDRPTQYGGAWRRCRNESDGDAWTTIRGHVENVGACTRIRYTPESGLAAGWHAGGSAGIAGIDLRPTRWLQKIWKNI